MFKKAVSPAHVTKRAPAEDEIFRTNDPGCAAALMCSGHDLLFPENQPCTTPDGEDSFVFICTSDLISDVSAYRDDTLSLPVRSYSDTIQRLTKKFYVPVCTISYESIIT